MYRVKYCNFVDDPEAVSKILTIIDVQRPFCLWHVYSPNKLVLEVRKVLDFMLYCNIVPLLPLI